MSFNALILTTLTLTKIQRNLVNGERDSAKGAIGTFKGFAYKTSLVTLVYLSEIPSPGCHSQYVSLLELAIGKQEVLGNNMICMSDREGGGGG